MSESYKSAQERLATIAESMKPASEVLKATEAVSRMMSNLPDFSPPSFAFSARHLADLPRIPTQEEANEYQSASVLMEALAKEAMQWKKSLPENFRPAILAVLYGGIQIHVQNLAQVSFHGIRIEGALNGAPCSLLAHQSTVQLLCYAEEVKPESPKQPIGFIWGNEKVEV